MLNSQLPFRCEKCSERYLSAHICGMRIGDDFAMKAPVHPAPKFAAPPPERKHRHYFKDCPYDEIDIYRVLDLFKVTDPCIGHALKKLLVAGGRGAGKDVGQDIQEAVDTLVRWQEMRKEEQAK